ncbi:hypothetical protein DV735_g5980, partial [Chaetothyriales sp. CBS 134920]
MHALRGFIRGLVDKTTTLFCDNLIHSDPQTLLDTRSPAGLFDNPSWAEQGANFTRFSENRGMADLTAFLRRLSESPHHRARLLYSALQTKCIGLVPQQRARLQRWLNDANEAVEMLALLALTTAGGPMRGTELLSWKYANTASGIRNLFILDGELVAVTEYSKTQAITGRAKVIAHVIPPPVAPLFISYIVDVMPLRTFILQLLRSDGIKPDKPATQPSYQLFEVAGRPLTTQQLSNRLADESTAALGVRLTVASQRQLFVAVRRAKVPGANTDDLDMEDDAPLQLGHSSATERQHYGITIRDIHLLDSRTLQAFQAMSVAWWKWVQSDMGSTAAAISADMSLPAVQAIGTTLLKRHRSPSLGEPVGAPAPTRARGEAGRFAGCTVDQVAAAVLGTGGVARRNGQDEAIQTVILDCCSRVILRLPPATGKTLILQAMVMHRPDKVTVLVVPYVALRQELVLHCSRLPTPISRLEWYPNQGMGQATTSLVLVTPEAASSREFQHYLAYLDDMSQLAAIVVDEAHVIPADERWRKPMLSVAAILRKQANIQIVLMSGTLSQQMEQRLMYMVSEPPDMAWTRVSRPVEFTHLSFQVMAAEPDTHFTILRDLNQTQTRVGQKMLIVTMKRSQVAVLAQAISAIAWPSKGTPAKQQAVLAQWAAGKMAMVGTSAIAVGTNQPGIGLVVH